MSGGRRRLLECSVHREMEKHRSLVLSHAFQLTTHLEILLLARFFPTPLVRPTLPGRQSRSRRALGNL